MSGVPFLLRGGEVTVREAPLLYGLRRSLAVEMLVEAPGIACGYVSESEARSLYEEIGRWLGEEKE